MTGWLFAVSIFLSAFLIFYIQPLLGKAMLPVFGGSAFVWVASVLFYQTGMLLGYLYAYLLSRFLSNRWQALLHMGLLLFSLYYLPLTLKTLSTAQSVWPPLEVLVMLTKTFWLPMLLISATSPLFQHWYWRITKCEFPYYFYSIGNAGSLLGLLGFVFAFEPFIGIKFQMTVWSWLYGLFVLLAFACLVLLKGQPNAQSVERTEPTPFLRVLAWVGLSFLGSALLLSVTQFLSQNVINLPMLWIAPLALYLITFIIVFSKDHIYSAQTWSGFFLVWSIIVGYLVYSNRLYGMDVVIVMLALLFTGCMVCHGSLISLKPNPKKLTLFYLCIALGGVLGGIFVNFVAILLFTNWWDFYLPLIVISVLALYPFYKDYRLQKSNWDLALVGMGGVNLLFLGVLSIFYLRSAPLDLIAQFRNPYGLVKIQSVKHTLPENEHVRIIHGTVLHGLQFTQGEKRTLATSYYSDASGVGAAIDYLHQSEHHPLQVGVIGLGSGTIAALLKAHDSLNFYEIDEDVEHIAREYFSFLADTPATVKVSVGDARILMEKAHSSNRAPKYDLLVVDAFSGDAIPFHLLTTDAMSLYMSHLRQGGIVAFNITNTYLNLLPVLKGLATTHHAHLFVVHNKADPKNGIMIANWGLISQNSGLGPWLEEQSQYIVRPTNGVPPILWSDDLNSILPLLKW